MNTLLVVRACRDIVAQFRIPNRPRVVSLAHGGGGPRGKICSSWNSNRLQSLGVRSMHRHAKYTQH